MPDEREKYGLSVMRPTEKRLCIVMVCTDMSEAGQVARQLSELNTGYLVTYRRVEDLMQNVPDGKVTLVILATNEDAAGTARTLKWLRNRWSRCPVTVVGDVGCGDHELVARSGGANYLTRPVTAHQWSDILSHVLGVRRQERAREQLGSRNVVRR